ncbi:MAG: mechanosensitive ion channel family protein, partial [Bdellovibrionota bacterium]
MNNELENIGGHLKKVWDLFREPIFVSNGSKISVFSLLISAIAIIVAINVAKALGRMVNHKLEQRGVDSGVRGSLEKFFRYGFVGLAILFSLDNLGISINSLAAVGAVLMVGIGFGLQNIAQNFISGIIILIERPIKVGDVIRVGNSIGKVIDIRVRSTIVQTGDAITIIVPNSKIVSEEV